MVACAADEMTSSELLNTHPSPHHPESRTAMAKPASRSGSSIASNQSFPFRLSGEHRVGSHPSARERAPSIVSSDQQSIYKQRIDSMFEDTRSTTYGQSGNNRRANFVQAKIEQMFQEIASSSEDDNHHNHSNNNNRNRNRNNISSSSNNNSSIENSSVENIDSTTITTTTTNKNQSFSVHYLGNVPLIDKDTTLLNLQLPLKLLYFKYRELELKNCKPSLSKLEISSDGLKVIQGARSELNPFSTIAVWAAVKCVSRLEGKKLAFLPLIADPDGQDKSSLFTDLNSENEINLANGSHSPLLAVVMRQHGSAKQLNCHVYVCSCSEDAIVMAANLYQALMASMKSKQIPLPQKQVDKPIRPPRKPKSKTSSEEDEILTEPNDTKIYLTHKSRMSSSSKIKDPSGDILTKVAIPRSRSFLMKHATRGNSLHQLFAEIRSQEGVTNMDDVLEKIVNANGMSFNDLKPLYKELLLKLAVTLTRDELYMRSKNIMKRQQKSTKRNRKRKTGFKYVFRKSVKKIHGKVTCNKQPSSFEFTSILFPTKRCVGPRNSSSTYSSYRTLQRRGMRDRARKHKEAVDSRLTNIANRELRRSSIAKESKKSEAQAKRESSSGYVSCSECSLTSCLCDTDSCAETDKCYCSLQNNKKQVITSTSWRHHLNKPPSTHTSRSLQLLLQQPITSTKRRPSSYTSRMDVYDELPPARRNSISVSTRSTTNNNTTTNNTTTNTTTPKFSSVDNLALDYELFRYNSKQNSVYSTSSQQRVLVVSARDNRGRLIYMGAAEKDKRQLYRDPAHEALAVKKSAEIASLFSDMKLSQTTDIRGIEFEDDNNEEQPEVEYNTLEPPEHPSLQNRRGSYPGSSLENSLGYLP